MIDNYEDRGVLGNMYGEGYGHTHEYSDASGFGYRQCSGHGCGLNDICEDYEVDDTFGFGDGFGDGHGNI